MVDFFSSDWIDTMGGYFWICFISHSSTSKATSAMYYPFPTGPSSCASLIHNMYFISRQHPLVLIIFFCLL
jgi:hypothetical protein